MNFGEALEAMRCGENVSRKAWGNARIWVAIHSPDEDEFVQEPFLYLDPADGAVVPWVAAQDDLLADDWFVVEEG